MVSYFEQETKEVVLDWLRTAVPVRHDALNGTPTSTRLPKVSLVNSILNCIK